MKVKLSWPFYLWVLFITIGALIEVEAIPPGLGLKLATAGLMVLKTVTTFIGKPALEQADPPVQS